MKLIHITDTHFVCPGQRLFGLDPQARLDAAVDDINTHHANADLVVLTGDLAHWGEVPAYAALRRSLDRLAPPYVPLIGNHDDRAALRAEFPSAPVDANGFIQGRIDTPVGRLLFLDTNQPGTHAGWYCERRQAWLANELASSATALFLFMHHPPLELGLAAMDRIGLAHRDIVAEIVRPHRHRVRHLFFGHVHRPVSGSWHGIPFSTLRATNHQVWLDWAAAPESIPGSHEPPAYAVVLIGAETVVVHTHDYLDSSPKFPLGSQTAEQRDYALTLAPGE
jgi:3',5'-cyclic AMP phosphodiesterase CpdA